jgi:hypothetical protein
VSCLEQCVSKWDLHGASGQGLHSQLSQTYQNFYVLHNDATKDSYTTICIMVLFCGELQTSSSFTSKLFLVLFLSFLETFFSCVCVNVKGAELVICVSGDMLVLIRTMCS